MEDSAGESRRRRALYRAGRRGTKEADLVMGGAARKWLLGGGDLETLEAFVEEKDADVLDWAFGRERTPKRYEGLLGLQAQRRKKGR